MNQTEQNGSSAVADSQAAIGNAREKLMDGLKSAIGEAENYLKESGASHQSGASATGNGKDGPADAEPSESRVRFEDTLRTAKADLRKLEDSLLARSRSAADATHVYVNDNPWKAVGIGAAVGLLLGVLIARK